MKMLERLVTNQTYLAVVGLGYVGLPLAVAFAEKVKTLGFDTDQEKSLIINRELIEQAKLGPRYFSHQPWN